jgi:hypothetical protein
MTRSKPTVTGPMSTQSVQTTAICPSLPLMPIAGDGRKTFKPRKRAPGMGAAAKAEATMTRRKSLKKQREGQKVEPR